MTSAGLLSGGCTQDPSKLCGGGSCAKGLAKPIREDQTSVIGMPKSAEYATQVDLLIPQVGGNARATNYDYTKGDLPELIDITIEHLDSFGKSCAPKLDGCFQGWVRSCL